MHSSSCSPFPCSTPHPRALLLIPVHYSSSPCTTPLPRALLFSILFSIDTSHQSSSPYTPLILVLVHLLFFHTLFSFVLSYTSVILGTVTLSSVVHSSSRFHGASPFNCVLASLSSRIAVSAKLTYLLQFCHYCDGLRAPTSPVMFRSLKRARHGGARIEVYRSSRPSQDEDLPHCVVQPSVLQRHITYSFLRNGKVTTRTSFLDTVDDRSRNSAASGLVEQGDASSMQDSFADSSTWQDRYSDLDIEYIHHIELDDVDGWARKRTAADNPLLQWVPEIDNWLGELIHLEGRCGYTDELCPGCETDQATIRCEDCQDLRVYCMACTVNRHAGSPFHWLKALTDTHFHRETLKNLGLHLQLGHAPGDQCPNPIRAFGDGFIVMDISGIHKVGLDFCGCEIAQSHPTQLLCNRMLPATSVDPKTAATFRLLETFHLISAQSKISGYEFYTALARRTDNTGVNPPKDRYPAFMRMMREWQHLKMLKCSGRGHDPGRVAATLPGGCAVLCPACLHPRKNLPADWADVLKDKSWLYRLFLSIDANFRLKRKKVSSDRVDPGLNHGYAYFVEEKAYKEHLHTYDKAFPDEISTCNNHDALKLASMKGAHQSTAASGIGTVDCV
ncbi:hypothetical protein SCP_0804210 [Sparassis crispa]|uniref:CxC2-like cysteine cluster KDZ transposase-associated domain-containing protein n=1 Tax=Sparassis crispa TaxID=139825 RepID=A0A401GUI2_9APHY|nr:hypothetical protein SCP_0804210 [Sparassis crispa]GBE85897.1 hypothetical protein SCP_0804210 [Sparassis crispa]